MVLNLFMMLYIVWYRDLKNVFSPFFWENKKKFYIFVLLKNSEKLSSYSNYEYLQMKTTKNRDQCQRKLSKKCLKIVKSPAGRISFEPPHVLLDTFFFQQTRVFESSEVKSKPLRQWPLAQFECHPPRLLVLQLISKW